MSKRESKTVWIERIKKCKSSGMRVNEWCKMNHVSGPAYYYWYKRIKDLESNDESSNPLFVEVPEDISKLKQVVNQSGLIISWKGFMIEINDEERLPMAIELISRLGDQSC